MNFMTMHTQGQPQFLEWDVPPVPLERARFEIVPVPLEQTVSYGKGTAGGPAALIEASRHLETFDGEGVPADAGICAGEAVACTGSVADVLQRVRGRVERALQGGRIPIVLGGEHTVTLGAVEALLARGRPFGVVQFDAHADLRDTYRGEKLSHACVMRRIVERAVPVIQLAVRSLSLPEYVFRRESALPHRDAADLCRPGRHPLALPADFPRDLYLTFDVDALDPAIMPGTGTPEPGGLFWYDALNLIREALEGRRLIGCDVVELAPIPGSHVSQLTAAKLAYALMAAAIDHTL